MVDTPSKDNPDSSFSTISRDTSNLEFNTPLPSASESRRSLWKRSKAHNLHPELRRLQIMDDLAAIKRTLTRKLNVISDKLKSAKDIISSIRSDKSLDADSHESEILRDLLDDLRTVDTLVMEKLADGNNICESLDPSEEGVVKWTQYQEEKEELFENLKETIVLIKNTLDRTESRSAFKSKANFHANSESSGTVPHVSTQIPSNDDQITVQNNVQFENDQSFRNFSESPNRASSASTQIPVRVNQEIWGNRLSYRSRAITGNSDQAPQLHLPRHFFEVEIPKFDGTHETWDNFWSMFYRFVHSQNFENSVKLGILSKHCVGPARKYVDLARQNGDFYERTVQKMINTFDNAYKKRNSLLKTLEQIKKAGNSANNLDMTLARIRTILQGLETCDNVNSANLQRDIKSKFPVEIVMKMEVVERQFVGNWTTEKLLNALEEEIELLQIEEDIRRTLKGDVTVPSKIASVDSKHSKSSGDYSSKYCVFHEKSGHVSSDCRKQMRPHEIRRIAKDKNLCLNCLEPNHKASDCTKPSCPNCAGAKHNVKLCENQSVQFSRKFQSGDRNRTPNYSNPNGFVPQNSNNGFRRNFQNQSNFAHQFSDRVNQNFVPNQGVSAPVQTNPSVPPAAGNYGQQSFRPSN